jgi:hypothetical protein
MSCDCFGAGEDTAGVTPDPTKHVNYVLGMVLGADDFLQEFGYHAERGRWAARDLAGYGTTCGLHVTVERNGDALVRVEPGLAVLPSGQLVRVTPVQCASLNGWLEAHEQEPRLHDPPGRRIRLYVTLGYRPCLTDQRPVPGEPCRSETDVLQPGRITDGFDLQLGLDPPAQDEEEAIRGFLAWLRENVEAEDQSSIAVTPAEFADAVVRGFAPEAESASVPAAPVSVPLVVPAGRGTEYLRAALGAWVTRIRKRRRPNFLGEVHSCEGNLAPQGNRGGDRLLLAAVDVELDRRPGDTHWAVKGLPAVDESDRPLLVSSRLLLEALLAAGAGGAFAWAPPTPQPPPLPRPPLGPQAPSGTRLAERAAAAPEYAVVAAGLVSAGSTTPGYRGLRVAKVLGPGALLLTFDALGEPERGEARYVVKAMPAQPADDALPAKESITVSYGGYREAARGAPAGLVLRVRDGGALVSKARLEAMELAVEVCRLAARR